MSDGPIIRLRGVSKNYGATRALNDVDLEIMPGTIVGLLGPNGAGKTTLLGHLPGLLLPTTGTVETFGMPAARLDDEALARIGYVSQEPRLMEWLTVAETMDFVKRSAALGRHPGRAPAEELRSGSGQSGWAPSPRACDSAWPSCWPWRRSRSCCSWTNPPPPWTRWPAMISCNC